MSDEKITPEERGRITRIRQMPRISSDSADEMTPGVMVEYSWEEAERMGAIEETAMSEEDAWEANADLADDDDGTAIVQGGQTVSGSQ